MGSDRTRDKPKEQSDLVSILGGSRVLCVSPHPDDVELGMGATLHKYRLKLASPRLLVLSNRRRTRGEVHNARDQRRAAEMIGIDESDIRFHNLPIRFFSSAEVRDKIRMIISKEVAEYKPDVIFCPDLSETMQDHQATAEEIWRVVRGEVTVIGYETAKHNRMFIPNFFVKVGDEDIHAKAVAVQKFSEFTNRYYFEEDGIRALAKVRALNAGFNGFAEAFNILRLYSS